MKIFKDIAALDAFKALAFTSADICAIIKECGHSGIREFNYLGLELRYGPLPPAQAIEPMHVPFDMQQNANSQARESIQKSEQEIKDDLLQTMLIEDPVAYEQLMREGELIDGDGNEE